MNDTDSVTAPWEVDDTATGNSPYVPDEFEHGADSLREIYAQLTGLLTEDERDEENLPLRPTAESWRRAIETVQTIAYATMKDGLPAGSVTCGNGGVKVEWWNGQGCVILSVGDSPEGDFVFLKSQTAGDPGRLNKRVLPQRIATQLRELFD